MPTGRTLLLADDSPTIQKVVSLTFGDEGLRVLTVGSGSEALAQLEHEAPDVLLADVHMPAPGGYELCARVKRDARLRHVPVLLLVGAFEPFDEAEARECGADGVLTKPFQSIRDLVNKVGGLLGGHADPIGGHADPKRSEEDERRAAESSAAPHADGARHAVAPAAEASAAAAPPARPDLDLDDESIETASAESFAARAREAAAEARGEVRNVETSSFSRDAEASAFAYDAETPTLAREKAPAPDAAPAPFTFDDSAAPSAAAQQQQRQDARGFVADDTRSFATGDARGLASEDARSFAAAASGFHPPAAYDSRAASASAEDSLLELDDIVPAPAADSDDFILDFDEDSAAASRQPAAFDAGPHVAEAPARSEESSAHFEGSAAPAEDTARFEDTAPFGETAHFGETASHSEAMTARVDESPADISPANLSSAWNESELFEVSTPARGGEQPAASAFESGEAGAETEQSTHASASQSFPAADEFQVASDFEASPELDVAPDFESAPGVEARRDFEAAPELEIATDFEPAADFEPASAGNVESAAATLVDKTGPAAAGEGRARAEVAEEAAALGASAESSPNAPHEPASAAQLSPEMIDAIARRVVEQMSERVLREIAWEVVPDLAERLIRQRLEEDRRK